MATIRRNQLTAPSLDNYAEDLAAFIRANDPTDVASIVAQMEAFDLTRQNARLTQACENFDRVGLVKVGAGVGVKGEVLSANVTGGGSTYAVGDPVVITGDGTGATAEVSEVNAGAVTAIKILTGGSGYTTATLDLTGSGDGLATATAVLSPIYNLDDVITAINA